MIENTCNTCLHYRQHYTFDKRKLFRVHCGHCTYKKVRTRRPDANICEDYVPANAEEQPFVSKEYLSKSLLEYVLHLELLPEIIDADV